MEDFTFLNFLIGPLGNSFEIIKERGYLFSEENFQELPQDILEKYNKVSNSQKKKMFYIGISSEDRTIELVTELEKLSLIQASEVMKKIVNEMDSELTDEKEIIDKFASEFNFLTDIKTEPKIFR